jgi:16S rRNA (adenine1518-N6/adenine1519-N6)-dimethyltransferase
VFLRRGGARYPGFAEGTAVPVARSMHERMDLSLPRSLRARTRVLLARYRPLIKRSLGQHFLVDDRVLACVLDAADLAPDETVVEVGPGLGALTFSLVQRAGQVVAIEKDEAYVQVLREALGATTNLTLIAGDVLRWAPTALLEAAGLPAAAPYKVVANLPYAVAAPVLRHFLEAEHRPRLLVVMLQREVAQNLVDPRRRSLFAVSVQFYGEPSLVTVVPPRAFLPPPQVHSAVVRIMARSVLPPIAPAHFFPVVRAGFTAPRQHLRNSLARGLRIPAAEAAALLEEAGIAPQRRAETLSLDEWVRLALVVLRRAPEAIGAVAPRPGP